MIHGVDVSHHQGNIDWRRVAADGHSFALLKASEGTGFSDDRFAFNRDSARDAGLLVGAYHFLQPGNADNQADYFLARLGSPADMMLVVDVETTGSGGRPTAADASRFVARLRYRLGAQRSIGLYTGKWYWDGVLGNPPLPPRVWLWESRYVTGSGAWRSIYAKVPTRWLSEARVGARAPTLLQYSSGGRVSGIAGTCDLNAFEGTLAELRSLAGTQQEEDDMPTPDEYADAVMDKLRPELTRQLAYAVGSVTGLGGNSVFPVKAELREALQAADDDPAIADLLARVIRVQGQVEDLLRRPSLPEPPAPEPEPAPEEL